MFAVVGEYREAGDGAPVFVVEAVVVGEESFGKVAVVAALDFDVDVDPLLAVLVGGYLDEFVDEAFAEFGIFDDLGKLLVEKGVAARPVDAGAGVGEVEGDEFGKWGIQLFTVTLQLCNGIKQRSRSTQSSQGGD